MEDKIQDFPLTKAGGWAERMKVGEKLGDAGREQKML